MTQGGQRFRRRALRRGYKPDEVDDFLARAEATLAGEPVDEPATAQEVHDVVFRVRFGGYDEWQVDVYLDRLERQLTAMEEQGGVPRPAPPPRHDEPDYGPEAGYGPEDGYAPAPGPEPMEPAYAPGYAPERVDRGQYDRDYGPEPEVGRPPRVDRGGDRGVDRGAPDRKPPRRRASERGLPPERGMPPERPERGMPPDRGMPDRVPQRGMRPDVDERYARLDEPTTVARRPPERPGAPAGPARPVSGSGYPPASAPPHRPSSGPPAVGPPPPPPPPPPHGESPYGGAPIPGMRPGSGGYEVPGRHGKADMTSEIRSADSPFTPDDAKRLDQLRRTFQLRRFGSGYDRAQVDRLFDAVGATMAGNAAVGVTDGELDAGQFSLVQGGYFEAEVDAALREVRELFARRGVTR